MAWKSFKEHYRIEHIVHMRGGNLHIGSAYITDIIVVCPEGTIIKRYEDRITLNEDLARYQKEIDADPEKARALLAEPDVFARSVPCWTFGKGGEIVEKQCESMEWPNCTHDGELIYENTFFTTPLAAAAYSYNGQLATVEMGQEHLERHRREMGEITRWMVEADVSAEKLARDFPEMVEGVKAKRAEKARDRN